MKKLALAVAAVLTLLSLAGCGTGVGKGKAPPPVVTKGKLPNRTQEGTRAGVRVPFRLRANKEPQAVYAGLGFGGVCSKASSRAAEGSGMILIICSR